MARRKGSIYELRIDLLDVQPKVWRRFRIDSMCSLSLVHLIIQHVMGWKNQHLHVFQAAGKQYGPITPDGRELWDDERRYHLKSIAAGVGQEFSYVYDLGDHWAHRVIVEKELERSRSLVHPKCIAGENACPPEDCGGPSGYAKMKLILANPSLNQHANIRQWVGDRFDPSEFDLRHQNLSMNFLRGTRVPNWAR